MKEEKENAEIQADVDGNKLFVGNLSYSMTEEYIREFFKDCGNIEEVFWICNTTSGKFSGMGFITFESIDGAKKAIALHETECMGRRIKIRVAKPYKERKPKPEYRNRVAKLKQVRPLSERPDECYTVFIGNLSYDVTEESLRKFAEEKSGGSVAAVRWIEDRETGDFKGAGYLEFHSTEAVDEFVKQNGEAFMMRQIRVDYATSRA
mmetsp:Transcript_7495/g.11348  ORF Transcript_7495/g.11348 Transcript_7495/m.11348 type:complete len:207 (-) Transcript_7495:74-694(-)